MADDPKDDATLSHMESEANLEYTLIRGWMEQWLKWVRWYAETGLNLSTPLLDLLDYPVVERHWKRQNKESTILRFGLLWRVYDMAHQPNINMSKVFAVRQIK